MILAKALEIIKEFQKWRRSEKPYDGETPETYRQFSYSPKQLGEALDCIIKFVDVTIQTQSYFAAMGAKPNFYGVVEKPENDKKI